MVFHWSLNDSKSPQVSRTLLCVLANLNNVVVWMVPFVLLFPTLPIFVPILLVTAPRAPITIGITVTFKLHSFFGSLARLRYLSLPIYTLRLARIAKFTIQQALSFLLIVKSSDRLAEIS